MIAVDVAALVRSTVEAAAPQLVGHVYADAAFDVDDLLVYMVYSFAGGAGIQAFGGRANLRQIVDYSVYAPVFVDNQIDAIDVVALEHQVYSALIATGRVVGASGLSTAYIPDLDRRAASREVSIK